MAGPWKMQGEKKNTIGHKGYSNRAEEALQEYKKSNPMKSQAGRHAKKPSLGAQTRPPKTYCKCVEHETCKTSIKPCQKVRGTMQKNPTCQITNPSVGPKSKPHQE